VVSKKDTFCYLESMFQKDEDIDEDVSHRIKVFCVFCDPMVPQKLKDKLYKTTI
jgi:hypothetical protein